MKPYDDFHRKVAQPNALLVTTNKHYRFAGAIVSGSVLDAGAGFQTLKDYILADCVYTAIDATQWVCDLGGATFGDVMDYSLKHDYVCAFGILETADDLNAMAAKLKSLANVAVLFSFIKVGDKVFKAYTDEQLTAAFGDCTFESAGSQTLGIHYV